MELKRIWVLPQVGAKFWKRSKGMWNKFPISGAFWSHLTSWTLHENPSNLQHDLHSKAQLIQWEYPIARAIRSFNESGVTINIFGAWQGWTAIQERIFAKYAQTERKYYVNAKNIKPASVELNSQICPVFLCILASSIKCSLTGLR